MPVTHAVIPAAGRGTRLLPATRAIPKELLPLGRKPVLQHVVEELEAAGVANVVLVTARGKGALVDHLDGLEGLRARIATVHQSEQLGLGDAVRCAEGLTGTGPFVVALGDTLVGAAAISALVEAVDERGLDGAIALERVAADRLEHYGVAQVDAEGVITGLVEKPAPGTAPSDLAVAARYVLPPSLFPALAQTGPGREGEIQLTDAIAGLIADGAKLGAVVLPSAMRIDIGSPAGYAAAFTAHALMDPELAPAVRAVVDAQRG